MVRTRGRGPEAVVVVAVTPAPSREVTAAPLLPATAVSRGGGEDTAVVISRVVGRVGGAREDTGATVRRTPPRRPAGDTDSSRNNRPTADTVVRPTVVQAETKTSPPGGRLIR